MSCVKSDGKLAFTVALEALRNGRKVNVMLGDPGSVANFRFEDLTKRDLSLIKVADFVCVFNWNQNRYGTELAQKVFEFVGVKGKGKRFFDAGDPSSRKDEIGELMERVLKRGIVDILSLNENEAAWLASYFNQSIRGRRIERPEVLAKECARILYEELKVIIDLHTADYSLSIVDGKEYLAPTFEVEARRITGAGDAWNAADIYAYAAGMPHFHRLYFANAYAARYISNPNGQHPRKEEVVDFLKNAKQNRQKLSRGK